MSHLTITKAVQPRKNAKVSYCGGIVRGCGKFLTVKDAEMNFFVVHGDARSPSLRFAICQSNAAKLVRRSMSAFCVGKVLCVRGGSNVGSPVIHAVAIGVIDHRRVFEQQPMHGNGFAVSTSGGVPESPAAAANHVRTTPERTGYEANVRWIEKRGVAFRRFDKPMVAAVANGWLKLAVASTTCVVATLKAMRSSNYWFATNAPAKPICFAKPLVSARERYRRKVTKALAGNVFDWHVGPIGEPA